MMGIIEACSPGPRLEMFARFYRYGWHQWGDQVEAAPLKLVEPERATILKPETKIISKPASRRLVKL
jgi:N6-adenosine-specific RNA methylase IME4